MIKNVFALSLLLISGQLTAEDWTVGKNGHEVGLLENLSSCRQALQSYAENHPSVLMEFDELAQCWINHVQSNPNYDIALLFKGVRFAAMKHQGQYRLQAGLIPYIIHPIGVAKSLWIEGGIRNINVLVAALLHDTIEDTNTTADEIEREFGYRIRYTVEEVSDDPALLSNQNKQRQVDHAPHMTLNAQLVKLADRLYNVRDMKNELPGFGPARIRWYMEWSLKLVQALQGTHEQLEESLKAEISLRLTECQNCQK